MSIFDIGTAVAMLGMKGIVAGPERTSGRAGSLFLPAQQTPARGTASPFRSCETMWWPRGES